MNYAGTELAAMAEARNYQRWILSRCRPHLGRVVLEHGAGLGTYSTLLLREDIDTLLALEPADNLVAALGEQLAEFGGRARSSEARSRTARPSCARAASRAW